MDGTFLCGWFVSLALATAAPIQTPVPTMLGPKAFLDGDVIEITDVQATSPRLEQGDTVTVRGRYRLASHENAQLALYLTQTESGSPTETDPTQVVEVDGLRGKFELKTTIAHRGALHVTFYELESGRPFGGVYFGTAEQMKRIADWDVGYYLEEAKGK
jgi:hypothetical protein